MKSPIALSLLLSLAAASPTATFKEVAEPAHIVKRATITDAASIGYASVNGGCVSAFMENAFHLILG